MNRLPIKFGCVVIALLALAMVLAPGCSGGDEPAQASAVTTGNQVGDTVHPFSLRLPDGSIVTSGDLLERKRPTFLMFYQHP